ncbi:MAG: hypothetical protein ACSLFM_06235 [Tepidiformaceae bacterium]
MKALWASFEDAWLWAYTAGMPPSEADDRRAEVRSDRWEFDHYAAQHELGARDRVRRLFAGAVDDIAWRVSFGRGGLSPARSYESIMLVGLAALVFVTLPASAWWAISLAGNPDQPAFQVWYIATESVALACSVVGGAAAAAYYPRWGRALMLCGSAGLAATLWWTPVVAAIVLVAAVVTVLSLPSRAT